MLQFIFANIVWIILGIIAVIALFSSIVLVQGDKLVVLERKWIGKEMTDGRTVALKGEVGVRARILGPGFHFLIPFIYSKEKHDFLTIEPGYIGLVSAITGVPLPADKIMAHPVDCDLFQDGEAFLKEGGQKGRQLAILPEGEYRINPHLFEVKRVEGTEIKEDQVGIVESIAGERVERIGGNFGKPVDCDSYQDAVAFLKNGGEKGPQIDFMLPGYYRINKLMFTVKKVPLVEIKGGHIGLVEALDGARINESRILGKKVEGHENYFDGKAFIDNGGERGRQMEVLMPGLYRINTDLFNIVNAEQPWIDIKADEVGIVTTLEGASLKDKSTIAAEEMPLEKHKNFQNPQAYMDAKGQKGLQIPVLRAGNYAINPWFAAVEKVDMTEVKIGNCGVVTSFVGEDGEDTTEDTVNAKIVPNGCKGIWEEPLQPGMHPINTKICDVAIVPTIQILLSWAESSSAAHELDSNLKTIVLRTKDAFNVSMDVNVIVHIPMKNAPKVIANLGSVEDMISQVLEPAISAHFRNAAQQTPALELYTKRMELQKAAKEHIETVLGQHHIDSKDTLIADVVLPEELTRPVQQTEIAAQNKIMFGIQKLEEDSRIEFENSKEQANQQQGIVEAERDVDINKHKAQSEIATAEGEKAAKELRADGNAYAVEKEATAEATAVEVKGIAEGKATYAVGSNEAKVILEKGEATAKAYDKQVNAMGEAGFVQMMVMKEMAGLKDMNLIPQNVVIGGNGDGSGGTGSSLMDNFLGLSVIEKLSGRPLTPELKEEARKVDNAKGIIAFLEKASNKELSDDLKTAIESNFPEEVVAEEVVEEKVVEDVKEEVVKKEVKEKPSTQSSRKSPQQKKNQPDAKTGEDKDNSKKK